MDENLNQGDVEGTRHGETRVEETRVEETRTDEAAPAEGALEGGGHQAEVTEQVEADGTGQHKTGGQDQSAD